MAMDFTPDGIKDPRICVVIPCRHEARFIGAVLESLAAQDIPHRFEVIVADGMSTDGTREILHDWSMRSDVPFSLRIVDNPATTIPAALNIAVNMASGDYIIRIDGHCTLEKNYLREILSALQAPGADIVGPRMTYVAGGDSLTAKAIAGIQNSPLGNGGTASRNRLSAPVAVEHSPMSCYKKSVWVAIGGYDESLLSNEDFDFDYRAKMAGYRVFALPCPVFSLIARRDFRGLAKQRWRYGFWKAQVIKRAPRSMKLRQVLPAVLPAAWLVAAFHWEVLMLFYSINMACAAFGLRPSVARQYGVVGARILPFAVIGSFVLMVVHLVWAAGLWIGILTPSVRGAKSGNPR